MGPPTTAQRLDFLEQKVTDLEETMKEMVAKSVETAIEAMRHSLTEVLMEGQNLTTKKLGVEIEAMTERLEGRISRSREYHETLINTMRTEQLKFQAEMRSTVTGVPLGQGGHPDKGEASVNRHVFGPGSYTAGGPNGGGHSGGLGGPSSNWRYRKLDMPVFDGSDPDGWVLRVERYFNFYKMSEEEMLDAAAVAMEGDALRWY